MRLRTAIQLFSAAVFVLPAVASAAGDDTAPEAARSFDDLVRPFLTRYCVDCHSDPDVGEVGLDLAQFDSAERVRDQLSLWKAVHDQIDTYAMPPGEADQPSAAERRAVLGWIREQFTANGKNDPGRPVLRRLTRLEYNNTVRDLFGLSTDVFMFPERLPLDPSRLQLDAGQMPDRLEVPVREYGQRYPVLIGQAGLPGDGRAEHGYRNRGDLMNVSPLLLEEYVALAGQIVRSPKLPVESEVFRQLVQPPNGPVAEAFAPKDGAVAVRGKAEFALDVAPGIEATKSPSLGEFRSLLAEAVRNGTGGVFDGSLGPKGAYLSAHTAVHVELGKVTVSIVPGSTLWSADFSSADEPSHPHLLTNREKGQKNVSLAFSTNDDSEYEINGLAVMVLSRRGEDGIVTLIARMRSGDVVKGSQRLDAKSGNAAFTFLAPPGESIRALELDGSDFSGDFLLFDDLAFITRKAADAPRDSEEAASLPAGEVARKRLAEFLPRAFRRRVSDDEIARYATIFQNASASGQPFDDAMKLSVQAVLASPSFLFLPEPIIEGAGEVRTLTHHELATRLSYFLWSSMPDEELLRLADAGQLQSPAVLRAQVERMLHHSRARELSESFAVQWLRLDQIYTARPDQKMFKLFYSGPQGKGTLHSSLIVEPLLLFETILTEDRSILEFIDADYTWVNPRLADLYHFGDGSGLLSMAESATDNSADSSGRELPKEPDITEKTWIRVPLTDRTRGGVLTMAGPLTVTSLPSRTSPVKRGSWLLETILNRPPNEPKVAVPPLDREVGDASDLTVRQKLERHRADDACALCHDRIDPPGFALEAFDAIGRFRTTDGDAPVDASGVLPDGRSFNGPAEFKAQLLARREEFVRAFVEHLLSYALGRKLHWYDVPTVQAIEEAVAANDFRFSSVITEIVLSRPFLTVRNEPPPSSPEEATSAANREE